MPLTFIIVITAMLLIERLQRKIGIIIIWSYFLHITYIIGECHFLQFQNFCSSNGVRILLEMFFQGGCFVDWVQPYLFFIG